MAKSITIRKVIALDSDPKTHRVVDILDLPVNIINDRLSQAYATLDLIYAMTVNIEHQQELLETLSNRTLGDAMHSAMLRIEEAMEAAERIEVIDNLKETAHG